MTDSEKNSRPGGNENPLKGENLMGMGSGILDGVANILGRLGELAEKSEQLRKHAETQTSDGKSPAGSFDFSVKFGNAGDESTNRPGTNRPGTRPPNRGSGVPHVKPMQTGRSSEPMSVSPTPVVRTREPHVDVFDEGDHLMIVAEMPGVSIDDVIVSQQGQKLAISGSNQRVDFQKSIDLPHNAYQPPTYSLHNGVLEIKIRNADPQDATE